MKSLVSTMMHPHSTSKKPIKHLLLNGIQTNIKLIVNWLKKNSKIFPKRLMFSQTVTKENTMMTCWDWNSHYKMPTRLSKNFTESMESLMNKNKNSLAHTIPIELKITTRFLVSQKIHQWMKLKRLTENFHWNIIQKIIQMMKKPEKNLLKLMKLLMHFQMSLKEKPTMMYSLDKLPHLELIQYLMISLETELWNSQLKMNSLNQLLIDLEKEIGQYDGCRRWLERY